MDPPIRYSDAMNDTETPEAPDIPGTPGYPGKGKRLGPAWRELWGRLAADPSTYQDGPELCREIAPAHRLASSTLVAVLSRAAAAGLLEREYRRVETGGRGPRTRAHYRIKA